MNVVNVVPMPPPSEPPLKPAEPHVPVLTRELVGALAPRRGGVYVDATLGAGGHAAALLAAAPVSVIGLDRDRAAVALAERRLARFGTSVTCHHARFSQLAAVLADFGIRQVDGVVADLGLSSMQLTDPARGMSFRHAGPLDMRMNPERGSTARELIESSTVEELSEIIGRLGEERRARRVARCIKQAAAQGQLNTTLDLRRAVVRAVGPARIGGVDPATRTFQALRMAVNDELGELEALLQAAGSLVKPEGRIAVLSFHSLEDRICKRMLRATGLWQPLTKKPITPSQQELDDNPRARSAKLRAARRLPLSAPQEGPA